jgi:hypothetical protein
MIAATNGWAVAFDNLSHVRPLLSDAICRLATGGGFGTRELYSNGDEVLFDVKRPVILNGITELATRGDLLDRSIIETLPVIPEEKRRTEEDFWRDFEAVRPRILGALLDAVVAVLRDRSRIIFKRHPRMADFARTAAAAAPALGWTQGEFLDAYTENREGANASILSDSPLAESILAFMDGREPWEGSLRELLRVLDGSADEATKHQRGWPKSSRALSSALTRIAPNLRTGGVEAEKLPRRGNSRPWRLTSTAVQPTVTTVTTVIPDSANGDGGVVEQVGVGHPPSRQNGRNEPAGDAMTVVTVSPQLRPNVGDETWERVP